MNIAGVSINLNSLRACRRIRPFVRSLSAGDKQIEVTELSVWTVSSPRITTLTWELQNDKKINDHEPKIPNSMKIIEVRNIYLCGICLFQVVTKDLEGLDATVNLNIMLQKTGMIPISHLRLRSGSHLRLFRQP